MQQDSIHVLLIEDNPGDVRLLEEALAEAPRHMIRLAHASTVTEGVERLRQGGIDLVLLDLHLPDGHGVNVVDRIKVESPETPIIVFTGARDDAAGLLALELGAQDYLVKDELEGASLERALLFALTRHRTASELLNMSVIDDLTRLHNRRGFFMLARQQLAVTKRTRRRTMLLFADVDDLKDINDQFGHPAGDAALVETARVLRETFRKSDIIARMGGDEFAVMALETSDAGADAMLERLRATIDQANRERTGGFPLELSLGALTIEPGGELRIEELLAQADRRMYEQKRERRRKRTESGNNDPGSKPD